MSEALGDFQNDSFESDPAPRFDLWQLLVFGIARSRRLVLTSALIGLAIALAVGILTPNTYISESKLFLRIGRREQVTFETFAGSIEEPTASGPTIRDEMHMLSDRAIYERVADELGPAEVLRAADPSHYDDENTSLPTRALHELQALLYGLGGSVAMMTPDGGPEALRAATKVLHEHSVLVTEPESNVITVLHTSTSPERARAYNQAIVDAFVDRHAGQFSIGRYLEENRRKLIEAEKKRDEANKTYFDLLEQCGFYDFEAQRPTLIAVLEEQEGDLFTALTTRGETIAQRDALLERIRGVPTQIEIVREVAPNPAYGELRDAIADFDVTIAGLDVRISSLEQSVTQKTDELARLRDCERQHAYLATTRDAAAERYQALVQRFDMLEGLAGLRDEASNLAVMQAADVNYEKVGPQRGKVLVMGLFGGLFLGIALAVLRELLDRRLRWPHAIERTLGVRMLDVIPDIEFEDIDQERPAA